MKEVTNRDELLQLHVMLCTDARHIMAMKNHDYAGGADSPFSNFEASRIIGVEPEIGLLMRCIDKFKRVEAFVKTGDLKVKEESVFDALTDVINYMVLLGGLITVRQARQQEDAAAAEAYDWTKTHPSPVIQQDVRSGTTMAHITNGHDHGPRD